MINTRNQRKRTKWGPHQGGNTADEKETERSGARFRAETRRKEEKSNEMGPALGRKRRPRENEVGPALGRGQYRSAYHTPPSFPVSKPQAPNRQRCLLASIIVMDSSKVEAAEKPSGLVDHSGVERLRHRRLLVVLRDQGFHGAYAEYVIKRRPTPTGSEKLKSLKTEILDLKTKKMIENDNAMVSRQCQCNGFKACLVALHTSNFCVTNAMWWIFLWPN